MTASRDTTIPRSEYRCCRDCQWVGRDDDFVAAAPEPGADVESVCPRCQSDYTEIVPEVDVLKLAAEVAYSEMAFALHDICDARRRLDTHDKMDYRSERLSRAADELRAALDQLPAS